MDKYWPTTRLHFTDNLALSVNVSIQLQQKTDSLKSNVEKFGLCINTSKTKIQRIGNWNKNATSITVDERLLEKVQIFQYRGSYQTPDDNIGAGLRIEKSSAVFKLTTTSIAN